MKGKTACSLTSYLSKTRSHCNRTEAYTSLCGHLAVLPGCNLPVPVSSDPQVWTWGGGSFCLENRESEWSFWAAGIRKERNWSWIFVNSLWKTLSKKTLFFPQSWWLKYIYIWRAVQNHKDTFSNDFKYSVYQPINWNSKQFYVLHRVHYTILLLWL